jgi:hypothetical protein
VVGDAVGEGDAVCDSALVSAGSDSIGSMGSIVSLACGSVSAEGVGITVGSGELVQPAKPNNRTNDRTIRMAKITARNLDKFPKLC